MTRVGRGWAHVRVTLVGVDQCTESMIWVSKLSIVEESRRKESKESRCLAEEVLKSTFNDFSLVTVSAELFPVRDITQLQKARVASAGPQSMCSC